MKTAALGLLGLVLSATTCSEVMEASYSSLAEAKAQGAVERGWVPAWLPESARELKEKHDLDTNSSILRFAYSGADTWAPRGECYQIRPLEAKTPGLTAPWWPTDVPPPSTVTHRHAYFTCERGATFLAVGKGEGLYWRP